MAKLSLAVDKPDDTHRGAHQVITFGWKAALGVEVASARAEQKQLALAEAVKPKEKVIVDEGDLDMFS